ncbi:DUF2914 domain-containing protein [Gammaproteobacteria bacterium LSUCC0112]|nr:DUF2914 domain-containing protein [Gammaproteobacteria bacterium LSUCC0112]
MAIVGFISGVASYVLVEGREAFAQTLAILMLVSWLLLVLEPWIRLLFHKMFGVQMPPVVMRVGTQMVHQESLFFALSFFLAATTWNHAQALFTATLTGSAVISVIDPIYHGQLAKRRGFYLVFHAMTLFAVLLVVLPLLLLLNTEQSLQLALIVSLVFSVPSLFGGMPNGHWWRMPLRFGGLIVLGLIIWQARTLIPPASLELNGITLSQQVDRAQRTPGESLQTISEADLRASGLYAWTHKLNFYDDVLGSWQIRVLTDSGQLIGLARFEVAGSTQ